MTRARPARVPDGTRVDEYTLDNGRGLRLHAIAYGAIVMQLHVPGRDGRQADVVLGFDALAPYLAGPPYFGCIVGRVAGRVPRGRFAIDGVDLVLAATAELGDLAAQRDAWHATRLPRGRRFAVRTCFGRRSNARLTGTRVASSSGSSRATRAGRRCRTCCARGPFVRRVRAGGRDRAPRTMVATSGTGCRAAKRRTTRDDPRCARARARTTLPSPLVAEVDRTLAEATRTPWHAWSP